MPRCSSLHRRPRWVKSAHAIFLAGRSVVSCSRGGPMIQRSSVWLFATVAVATGAAARSEWSEAVEFFCGTTGRPNRADDPELAPTRVFDNLFALGRTGTVVW